MLNCSIRKTWSQPAGTSRSQLTHPHVRKTPYHKMVHPPPTMGKQANGNIK